MDTQLLPANEAGIAAAAALLQRGQVVAIPTETVYGLAANALDEASVGRIFAAKGRPQDNPLIVHIADTGELHRLAAGLPPEAGKLAEAFWPGPLTLVVNSAGAVAGAVSAGLGTIGVRMPAHTAALAVIREAGFPLAAPSANHSGSPSPTTAQHVLADLSGRIPLVLDGGAAPVGVESTVLSLAGEQPLLLRPGFVTCEELQEVLGRPVAVSGAVHAPLAAGERAASPGMKYTHYAPRAALTLVEGRFADYAAFVRLKAGAETGVWALYPERPDDGLSVPSVVYGRAGDSASQAAALFSALRALDDNGAATVYALAPRREGVGLAVYNRLLRAAGFRVVQV